MVAIKGTDCQKCPLLLSSMMCFAKHCVQGKILDDCPLVEIGIDIGDKDECAIYEYKYKGAKE